jgi:hypothetical protein
MTYVVIFPGKNSGFRRFFPGLTVLNSTLPLPGVLIGNTKVIVFSLFSLLFLKSHSSSSLVLLL